MVWHQCISLTLHADITLYGWLAGYEMHSVKECIQSDCLILILLFTHFWAPEYILHYWFYYSSLVFAKYSQYYPISDMENYSDTYDNQIRPPSLLIFHTWLRFIGTRTVVWMRACKNSSLFCEVLVVTVREWLRNFPLLELRIRMNFHRMLSRCALILQVMLWR